MVTSSARCWAKASGAIESMSANSRSWVSVIVPPPRVDRPAGGQAAAKVAERVHLAGMHLVRRGRGDPQVDRRARGAQDSAVARTWSTGTHASSSVPDSSTGTPSSDPGAGCGHSEASLPMRPPHRTARPPSGRGRPASASHATHAPCEKPPSRIRPGATPRSSRSSSARCAVASAALSCGSFAARGAKNRSGYHEPPGADGATQATSGSSSRSASACIDAASWPRPCSSTSVAAASSGVGIQAAPGPVSIVSSRPISSSRRSSSHGGSMNAVPRASAASSIAHDSGLDTASSNSGPPGVRR